MDQSKPYRAMKNTDYFLALNRIPGIGPKTVQRCLTYFPDLADLFRASPQDLVSIGLSSSLSEAIRTFDFNRIEMDRIWQSSPDQVILTWEHPRYPSLLKEIASPPIVLYAKGHLDALLAPCLGMVGTRKPTPIGSEIAWQFSAELASAGVTIVSGLALGIDAQAHSGCLAQSGQTVAVLGTGIDMIYPHRHLDLSRQIAKNGLLLSEFPLKSTANAGHFPRRNRIISGLSSAILVVEASIRSGSLITARFALEQNRDVMAIPGSVDSTQSRGCHQLLQQGAKLITSSQDVLDELNLDHFFVRQGLSNQNIACENSRLMQCIGFDVTSVERIMSRSGLSIQDLLCKLVDLEFNGMIKAVPGGYVRYKR